MTSNRNLGSPGKAARLLTNAGMKTHAQAVRNWAAKGRVYSMRTPTGRIMVDLDEIAHLVTAEKAS